MQKALDIAKRISKDLERNWLPDLEEINLHKVFDPVFKMNLNITDGNILVCAIIYSYSPDSKWIDLKQDGSSINRNVLVGLGGDISKKVFQEFIELINEDILDSIALYLERLTNWKFVTIRKMIDFHAKTMMEKEPDLKEVDEEKKPKVRENISRTMKEAVFQREAADKLIEQVEKEYVNLNHKTESDFGVKFTENNTRIDPMSWRQYIRTRNERKKVTS